MKILLATVSWFVFGTTALAAVLVSDAANAELSMDGLNGELSER